MKHIHLELENLHLDKALFDKMCREKNRMEIEAGHKITWEDYISILFSWARIGKKHE